MKITLRLALAIAIVASLGLSSCEKDFEVRSCDTPSQIECGFDSNKVNVRIANLTGYPLCDFNVVYRTDTKDIYDYGTVLKGEYTCYIEMDFVKLYPEVTFTLGTGSYTIPDSLIFNEKYSLLKQTSPGFFTFFIQIPYSLDSLKISTSFGIDDI